MVSGRRLWLLVVLAASTGAAETPPDYVDHYLCYKVVGAPGAPGFTPVERTLRDQLTPATTYTLKRVVTLCNPAGKNGEGMVHPGDHQVGYRLKRTPGSPRFARSTHTTTDQFNASLTLVVTRPETLLVPSSKVLGPGGAPPYAGTAVRHYGCYRAKAAGVVPPPPPTITDQFRSVPYAVRPKVTKLCTPVDKDGEDPGAPGEPGHLVCYRVRGPELPARTVSTSNQIRPEVLEVVRPVELCLPALKDGRPTTTTTSSTTTSTTTSTTSTTALACTDPANPVPYPFCWGSCPPATPICAAGPTDCECVAGSTPCGSASFPSCDGACGPGEACQVGVGLDCVCQFEGVPCEISGFPTCGGQCEVGDECVPLSTPDGEGCICVPEGSTCHGTYPMCNGTCPPGQTCFDFGFFLCGCV
jgi:hypothetical protein